MRFEVTASFTIIIVITLIVLVIGHVSYDVSYDDDHTMVAVVIIIIIIIIGVALGYPVVMNSAPGPVYPLSYCFLLKTTRCSLLFVVIVIIVFGNLDLPLPL